MCERENTTYTSKIGHFCINNILFDKVGDCFILDEFHSNHAVVPITLSVAIPHININRQANAVSRIVLGGVSKLPMSKKNT